MDDSGQAVIKDNAIVIHVPLDYLPTIVHGAWSSGGIDVRFKVTDAAAFALELVHALNHEAEDGTTLIHKAFDEAINYVAENGGDGFEEHEDQEG